MQKAKKALSWAKTSGSDGNYTYTDLSVKDDDGTLTIANAVLTGVHMDGDVASFDRADFSGIKMYDEAEDATVSIKTLSMARPTPDMAKAIITSLQNIKDIDDLNMEDEDLDMGFGALGMGDVKIESKELNLTTDSLMWGEDAESGLTDFKVQGIDFKHKGNELMTASLKSFSGTGLRSDTFGDMSSKARSPMSMMGGFNPLAKMYNTVKMEDLDFNSDYVSVKTKGFEGTSTEKGGVTTQRSVGEPLIIKLKEAPKDPDAKRAYDMVKDLGFDEIVLQSSQTTVLDSNEDTIAVKDGFLSMKDGFELSYNYGASGIKAMSDNMQDSSQEQLNIQAAMNDIKLNGFQLRLEDKSIVERGLKLASKFRGSTPAKVKQELKVALAFAPMMAPGIEGEMLGEIGSAFGEFIEKGGTLSIVVDPKQPLTMTDLANYKQSNITMDDIGFSAKAE
ncbi:hypothetical protein N9M10_04920 [Hellea sp.]|nr:hypothetical protein [Hellea sp.]